MTTGMQIAIDGPAASGKSTIAQEIARQLKATYINTGEMYRTLTQWCMKNNIDTEDSETIVSNLDQIDVSYRDIEGKSTLTCCGSPVDRTAIRTPEITAKVSIVAILPLIVLVLVTVQQWLSSTKDIPVMLEQFDGKWLHVVPVSNTLRASEAKIGTRVQHRLNLHLVRRHVQ